MEEQLEKLDLRYCVIAFGEVDILGTISKTKLKQLHTYLNNWSKWFC